MATKHSLILDDTNRDGISFPYVFFFSSSLADYYDDVKNAIDLPRNRKKNRSKVGREELPCWLDE
jgi:hypothetical protein